MLRKTRTRDDQKPNLHGIVGLKGYGEEGVSVMQWLSRGVGDAELGNEVVRDPYVAVVVHDVHINLHRSLAVHTET